MIIYYPCINAFVEFTKSEKIYEEADWKSPKNKWGNEGRGMVGRWRRFQSVWNCLEFTINILSIIRNTNTRCVFLVLYIEKWDWELL